MRMHIAKYFATWEIGNPFSKDVLALLFRKEQNNGFFLLY